MSALADKIRRSRQTQVEAGGYKFTISRPTHLQVLELQQSSGGMNLRNCLRFVTGWDVKECDLIPGGGGDVAPFDPDAFELWLEDQPALWGEIMHAIVGAYQKHAAKLEADAGNSGAG